MHADEFLVEPQRGRTSGHSQHRVGRKTELRTVVSVHHLGHNIFTYSSVGVFVVTREDPQLGAGHAHVEAAPAARTVTD